MPNYTIYIRSKDDKQWQKIDNRTAWIHGKLKADRLTSEYMDAVRKTEPPVVVPKPPEMSEYRWQQHLKDTIGEEPTITPPEDMP